MTIDNWAGAATLRLRGTDLLPGFAAVQFDADSSGWSGDFVLGGFQVRNPDVIAAELLLPRDVVVRATLTNADDSVFRLEGESPWPVWSLYESAAVECEVRPGYLEVRAPSRVTRDNWLRSEDLPLEPAQRVLFDYRPIQEITVPLEWFEDASALLGVLGTRVAVVVEGVVALGLFHALRNQRTPGPETKVFSDYLEARLWLLATD